MKKVLLTAVAVFAFGFANAQEGTTTSEYKPTKGTVTTEVSLTGGLNAANFNLNDGGVKFRYFLKDDLGLRLGLGIHNDKNEDVIGVTPGMSTETEKNSNLSLKLGAEKHFAGSERLSTYAGADLVIAFGKETFDDVQENGDYDKFEQKNGGFGVNVFTGADYYITKKVFLGVEAGLNFMTNKLKDASNTNKTGAVVTTVSTPGEKGSNLDTNVFGGVRIGFQF
ncbi:Outer membrane protein beta-barrel domain-containing protein [Flavobacterium swingsii]|jgi:outer membrane protein W|uniref:Outer membrane protein beta-barrel domain-containing protein n=1 Tax=Flavobacterium swingsii TaxID=498292 RepID=A0A1I0Z9R4_9FLAO|nr:outer membrane beta-barrel protein [Flavobacterium swingsii]SFB22142.1 Outer membrane protein beta-barrel domain-containing protein [Flavobacterium swingsii]